MRLEDGLKLDLNMLIRDDFVRPGEISNSRIVWCKQNSRAPIAFTRIFADMTGDRFGRLRLNYRGEDQNIQLEAAPRHFGGKQWYFICPFTLRRVSVLWQVPGSSDFASRQAWGRRVAYRSQFETWHDRALTSAQDIRYRLGGLEHISGLNGPVPKPKWMRWRTYDQLMQQAAVKESAGFQYHLGIINRWTNRS
jgi:hypothetical protein